MANIDFQNGYIAGLASKSKLMGKVLEKTIAVENSATVIQSLCVDKVVQANDNRIIETTVQLESEE